jgi:amino acid transporter
MVPKQRKGATRVRGLKRELSIGNLIVIGVAGAIGTGVLFSNAGMAADAGPGVVLAWLIGFVMYLPLALTYVELASAYPEAGGPSRYSVYTHGRVTNMINAFANLIWYLFIPPIEALATAEGINYFYPHLLNPATGAPTTLGALLGVLFMLLFLPFNYFGIKSFAQTTGWLGIIKLILYVTAAVGFVTVARFANFTHFGGLVPFGASGVFLAIPLGMFSFGAIRVIPDYAEEMKDPKRIGRAIVWSVVGQTVINLLFAVGFVLALNWTQLKLPVGHWADVDHIAGNPYLTIASSADIRWLVLFTVVIAILGPFVTGYIYQGGGSRTLFAMGRTGVVSRRMKEINERYAVPFWALLVFTAVGVIVAYIAAPLPSIYNLISDAVVAGYLGYAINPVVMMAVRRAGKPGVYKYGDVIAALAFAFSSLIIYWSGWPSVPYAVLLLALAVLVFGFWHRVTEGFRNALWYMAYILFLTAMTYVGGVGALSWFNMEVGTVIVLVVSLAVFLPWGVSARLPVLAEEDVPGYAAAQGTEA